MGGKTKRIALWTGLAVGVVGFGAFALRARESFDDPRQAPPLVRLMTAAQLVGAERGFTGTIGARVESNLGFRVAGKIVERLVGAGQQVKAGQVLIRIDETDLRLALTAKRNAVVAARASAVQTAADERRYSNLLDSGAISKQRYELAKAAADSAAAQLAAAEADARVAENEAAYSVLVADADGTVVETLGEPGQVVAAGQTVVRLAQSGPREAVVSLPENVRPAIGSTAEANVYESGERRYMAHLRQLSDSADSETRTYEARYVLDGSAASAPLGATVTLWLTNKVNGPEVEIPLGAEFDDGRKTGVWIFNGATSTVHFRPITLVRLNDESAVISGLGSRDPIVSLGAQLLHEGERVRTSESRGG
jgi:RND family efflux transporter MFP subunit